MRLIANIIDPLTDRVPPAWDAFVSKHSALPQWRSELLRTADWCARSPSSMVLVSEDGSESPIALFHARHIGLGNPARFAQPGRLPRIGMIECRIPGTADAGMMFSPQTDDRDRAEAVRVFERAMQRRAGAGAMGIAYRELTGRHLGAVPRTRRIMLRLAPRMVVHNQWGDFDDYLAALPRKWRSRILKINETIRADRQLSVELVDTIEPADACWLAEQVRGRYTGHRAWQPPVPARYFAQFGALSKSRFLTYRDADGRLLAYSGFYDNDPDLHLVLWGNRYEAYNLYYDRYLRMIAMMISSRRERIVMGKGMQDIKSRFGAQAEPLWGVVGLR